MSKSNDMVWVFSIISGILYEVYPFEVHNLDESQIILKSKPKCGCSKCYDRGYTSRDVKNGYYSLCSCVQKVVLDPEKHSKIYDIQLK